MDTDGVATHDSDYHACFEGLHKLIIKMLLICLTVDVDINAVLSTCDLEMDFSPFPSKIFALLYFLLHSPKPIVRF